MKSLIALAFAATLSSPAMAQPTGERLAAWAAGLELLYTAYDQICYFIGAEPTTTPGNRAVYAPPIFEYCTPRTKAPIIEAIVESREEG